MNKKRIILASTMAILIAPSILGNVSNQATIVNAATDTTASESTIKNPIGTVDYGGAYAYDSNGNKLSLFLSGKSSWKLGQSVLINGQRFYGIGANEYVNSANITVTDGMPPVLPTLVKPADPNQVGTLGYAAKVVDMSGNLTGRILPAGSAWKVNGLYVLKDGNSYYKVSSNEYVLATIVTLSTNATNNKNNNPTTPAQKKVGTLSDEAKVVDANGNLNGQTLPAGSSWQLGQLKTINGKEFYQVATNEYIPAVLIMSDTDVYPNPNEAQPVTTVINLYNASRVLDNNGNDTGKTMPAGSSWKADQSKTMHDYLYFRIAPNQWVTNGGTNSSDRIFANGPIAVTLAKDAQLYDTSSNSMTRTLAKGTSWRVFKSVMNSKGRVFAQVSSNEWIPLPYGVINDYAQGNSILNGIYYAATNEPNFAADFN